MKTVTILHGWAGGWWHTREFTKELGRNDFEVIKDARIADVILAHSTGCYRLPEVSKAKLVVLHGAPPTGQAGLFYTAYLEKKGTTLGLG